MFYFFILSFIDYQLFLTAMHLVVLNLTEQDCAVLYSTAISCSVLEVTGLG